MTKINTDNVSQCLLHCLKQTELKYDEALVHSSGLNKHGTFLMWKITKMTKISPFFFSQKFCITPFCTTDLLVTKLDGTVINNQQSGHILVFERNIQPECFSSLQSLDWLGSMRSSVH